MRPKAILFDAVGTLIHPDPPVAEAYHAVARRFGSQLTVAQIASRFASAFASGEPAKEVDLLEDADMWSLSRSLPTSPTAERLRWQQVVTKVLGDVPAADGEPFEALWNHFSEPRHWRLYDDAADVWRQLARTGVTLGIASNFDDRLLDVCRGLPPLANCELLFWSARVGYSKPSPQFFAHITQELALLPSEILLVGDDFTNDYLGAAAAGWRSVLLDRTGKHERTSAWIIRSLRELPALLG